MVTLEQRHYERLLDFRTGLRRFLRWSADQAATAGVTPAQHQLLLAIRGHPDPAGPTIREMAGYLLVRHHSAVELVDRAGAAGLVERGQDGDDLRRCGCASPRMGPTVSPGCPRCTWRSSSDSRRSSQRCGTDWTCPCRPRRVG